MRILTRDEAGRLVSFPERVGYPQQQRPLVVMTYNIEGHDELIDTDHAAKIAATINQFKPDIVGLQEVHDHTWQVRFRNQYEEIRRLTGMNGYFGRSYRQPRRRLRQRHPHARRRSSPRSCIRCRASASRAACSRRSCASTAPRSTSTSRTSRRGASLNAKSRGVQLECLAKHVRTSRYPYLLLGDFNAPPDAAEVAKFEKEDAAQLCGADIKHHASDCSASGSTTSSPTGAGAWRGARAIATGSSDHYPVIAQLFWSRN